MTIYLGNGNSQAVRILSVTETHALAVDVIRVDTSRIPFEDMAGISRNDSLFTGPFNRASVRRYVEPQSLAEASEADPVDPVPAIPDWAASAQASRPPEAADPAAPATDSSVPTSPSPVSPAASAVSTGVAAQSAGTPTEYDNLVCKYAQRQSQGMIMDLCRTMEAEPGLRKAWTDAYETSNRKNLLSTVTGVGGLLLVTIGWVNAMTNVGDCVDSVVDFEDRECGQKPVGIFLVSGAVLGVGSIVSMATPNTDRNRALALSRRP